MIEITEVEQLIDALSNTHEDRFGGVLKTMKLDPKSLAKFAQWEGDSYTRTCLHRADHFELILLCWCCGDKTPIHGHADQHCWVYQVDGEVTEVRYKPNEEGQLEVSDRGVLEPGDLTYMNDAMGYHHIENNGDKRAMTMHIYAKPIDSCEVYNAEKGGFEVCQMKYDSVVEEICS